MFINSHISNLLVCFVLFSDGEGHVWREPWSHPDPRTHPHHDWPGELLLPGGCLQESFWTREAFTGPNVCKLNLHVTHAHWKNVASHSRRTTSSLLRCSTWWWAVAAPSLQEAQAKACSPASTWTCSTGEVILYRVNLSWSWVHHNVWRKACRSCDHWKSHFVVCFAGIIGCTTLPHTTTAMRTVVCCVSTPAPTPDRCL